MNDYEISTQLINDFLSEKRAVELIKEFINKHRISCPESLYDNDNAWAEYPDLMSDICGLLNCYYVHPED